ncbi:GntR family transcriptional regulator [Aliivibrio fischeri]|uniref:GntR family transcriptional regulator n=1 Tax=Aliivibrio fischeri TaxID=668 RepID=UPI0007C5A713|nr:GntR family transcriptional regulator [Aliivibrio fischeri]MCE7536497.1 GntR family transcriptional regulator [Aliivibrio fischeri]MCE7559530.1 GntR family transcriptional regulator [Aliivibrio fischeri]TGA72509.1 GntR family transcriptional regulator [Aliivibrio fischeri]
MQYLTIKDAIEEQIDTGMFEAGQKLPSERTLAETFSTTRITLREALNHLALSGKIYKEERRGWFVSTAKLIFNPMQCIDIAEACKEQKRNCRIEALASHRLLATKEMLTVLKLSPFSYVKQQVSLIHIDGRRVAVQYRYIPEEMTTLLSHDEQTDVLTQLLNSFEYDSEKHEIEVGIIPASQLESDALNLSSGSMLLSINQVACNKSQTPFLLQTIRCCHDAINLKISQTA